MSIIRDSSTTNIGVRDVSQDDNAIRIGIIREEIYSKDEDVFYYIVDCILKGRHIVMRCRQLVSFGDVFNYEEWGFRTYTKKSTSKDAETNTFCNKPGEIVVVAAIGGHIAEGIIIGGLKHPNQKTKHKKNELSYDFMYNGCNVKIDVDGSYTITFNGSPTNQQDLESSISIPEPKYNDKIAGSSFKIEKDGSISISDNNKQIIKIDKANNNINISSDISSIKLEKEKISNITKDFSIESKNSNKFLAKTTEMVSKSECKISSPKVAIGGNGVELLDSLVNIVDALGKLVINSPNGPCQPVNTSPMWAEVESIKAKITSIKGSL